MRNILIIISCLMACIQAALADDREKTLFAMVPAANPQWQQTRAGMQAEEYRRSTRQNQEIVQQGLAGWASRKLADSGAYGPAMGILGATIDLAANDRRYDLNRTGTMGLLLRDSARSDRALLLEYRTSW